MALLGVPELRAALAKVAAQTDGAARATVAEAMAEVVAAAKGNFEGSHKKGEPHTGSKPNVVSGDLRRSIISTPVVKLATGEWGSEAGPTQIYGRRVELGFRGTDALGRRFNQSGYPYFVPAVEEVEPRFAVIGARNWAKFLGM